MSELRVRAKITPDFAGGILTIWRGANEKHTRRGLRRMSNEARMSGSPNPAGRGGNRPSAALLVGYSPTPGDAPSSRLASGLAALLPKPEVIFARTLNIRNRQRRLRLDVRRFRQMADYAVELRLGKRAFELSIFIVGAAEMARINLKHLQHEGSTDVITFPYSDAGSAESLVGDIFICIDDAIQQARSFKSTWQSELVRYFIHGLLHLEGYDDLTPAKRRIMKREENRLVRHLTGIFPLNRLRLKSPAGEAVQ